MSIVQPITILTEEEEMFREAVSDFAREQIGPHVMDMDRKGEFRRDIISQFYDLGLMGIEVPEEYGGTEGSFFMGILAIEALAPLPTR